MRTRLLVSSAVVALGLSLFACGGKKPKVKEPAITETVSDAGAADAAPPEPPKEKSLYERLGGKDAIAKVVDSFVKNAATNDVTKKRFAKLKPASVDNLKKQLVDQICEASGGECKYTGKNMKEAHKGMKITEAEWNATVSALKAALDEHKVGEKEQNDLIAAIAPMHDDIVEVKPKAGGDTKPKK